MFPGRVALQQTETVAVRPGSVTLIVRELDPVARFYEETVGLHRMGTERDAVHLGDGRTVLLVLQQRDVEPEPLGYAGLFHIAFLLPTRKDLGSWLRRAIASRVPLEGASDHGVSEAVYLADPEGNGIEVYTDRPRDTWRWKDGKVVMGTEPLDLRDLVELAAGEVPDSGRGPLGTSVGHIHLRVGDLADAETFYRGALGFDVTSHYPGATFYASGGYHHHIATNIWRSRNAPKRSGATAGLASFELLARDRETFDATAERLLASGGKQKGDVVEAADPWGMIVRMRQE